VKRSEIELSVRELGKTIYVYTEITKNNFRNWGKPGAIFAVIEGAVSR
jgi:hypothetical protein